MRIAVLVKQVPDSDEIKMDPVNGTMIREGEGNIVNPLDLNALEAALVLRREYGGSVNVLSMGPAQTDIALRETLALGADSAYLISDKLFAGADTWATSLVLAKTLKKLGLFDLVLAGEKATDGETGQVGPEVAAMLNIPCATYASSIKVSGENIIVRRTVEEGYEVQKLKLPCLITVLNDMNEPGMPTLSGKKRARRADIEKFGAADLGVSKEEVGLAGSPTRVVKISHPKISRQTEFYSGREIDCGLDRVVEILHDMAVL
ncbi:MAG: electron transfer flavoprotein subunit beta/FixA family protein [Synergistaceae bacterium]|nr:electron transfer flavoprotein subunit beta/FixA family protein [Synergistaceae bacterium]